MVLYQDEDEFEDENENEDKDNWIGHKYELIFLEYDQLR